MTLHVVLDTGPLSLACSPARSNEVVAFYNWLENLRVTDARVIVPEIADYELRRELLRAKKITSVARLDKLKSLEHYLPITTETMLLAAQLWSQARNEGRQTAPDLALDADVILAAQAITLGLQPGSVIVATSNVGHLGRFVEAARWQDI